jgi:hypothetical protein
MISGLQESGCRYKLNGSTVLQLVHESDKVNFYKNFDDALSEGIIYITDDLMVSKMKEIVAQNGRYTSSDIIDFLQSACEHADTFRNCGEFLNLYCAGMKDTQCVELITEGMHLIVL